VRRVAFNANIYHQGTKTPRKAKQIRGLHRFEFQNLLNLRIILPLSFLVSFRHWGGFKATCLGGKNPPAIYAPTILE
jgi:hypothetical protein